MTILLSQSGVVDSASGALSRILGHDPEVIEGRQLVGFVVEEDQPIFLSSLYTASQGATASNPLRVRIRLTRHETGGPVPFEFTFVNLLDDPTVGGFVVSAHDITEQVAAERELHQSEQRFRRVFNQGPLGIVLTDFEHRIIDVNDVFCLLAGRPSDGVIGSAFPSFVHTNDLERVRAVGLQLVEQPATTHKTEIRLESSNQEDVVTSVTASVIQDETGVPMHCLWVLEDITNRKMLEREFAAHANTASKLLASLTSREVEILELLEETATASQIAHRLTLSVRTVESHLANAYRKLGVHSRSAAIAEFARLTRAVAGVPHDQS